MKVVIVNIARKAVGYYFEEESTEESDDTDSWQEQIIIKKKVKPKAKGKTKQ